MNAFLPRGAQGLTVGPAPTRQLTPYSTGVSGFVSLVTAANELWEVDLQNKGAFKVATFSKQVLALESSGTWDNLFAIVNETNGVSFAKVNSSNGALTTLASLSYNITGLTKSGSNFVVSGPLNESFAMYAIISPSGSILSSQTFYWATTNTVKVVIRAGLIYILDTELIRVYNVSGLPQSASDPTATGLFPSNSNAPTCERGSNHCGTEWYYSHFPSRVYDLMSHPTAGDIMLWNYETSNPYVSMPYITKLNISSSLDVEPIVDLRISAPFAFDAAFFVRDRNFCSNKGNYVNNRECVCDNAALNYGARCESTYSAPVAAPVGPPALAPVSAPTAGGSSAPTSGGSSAPTSGGSSAPKASGGVPTSDASVVSVGSALFCIASAVVALLM
jgi:hypothetical protein